MTDQNGKFFVVQKHRVAAGRSNRIRRLLRRRFYEPSELEEARGMARKYADEHGEDFLVVMVVAEESKPGSEKAQ